MTFRLSPARIATFQVTALAAIAIAVSAGDLFAPRLVYNASASVPLGWYAVEDAAEVAPGDLVVVRPPPRSERLLVERRYLGPNVPLVKHVAAGAGAQVCRDNDSIIVNGAIVGMARDADGQGRALPRWSGCRTLRPGEIFLFNPDAPGSFDGRYFGPTPVRDIIGKARALWIW